MTELSQQFKKKLPFSLRQRLAVKRRKEMVKNGEGGTHDWVEVEKWGKVRTRGQSKRVNLSCDMRTMSRCSKDSRCRLTLASSPFLFSLPRFFPFSIPSLHHPLSFNFAGSLSLLSPLSFTTYYFMAIYCYLL